ncbi:ExbD/TolR family protein [Pelagicoccus albus]|uniref:Biopolymer transporter ExbD n=1 Tax=Pelagicoccus albus TaxID=415222 RepID=A0A7X1E7U9_9BACT|nr:biopolymer transporter ExbD [Pelagicoccus albus]MBC2605523.1 biopolymer transporter ExbD [Pelagicoccus albus]
MRNRKNLNSDDETTDINISPLIDMVFILLIFFIVTTVFVEESGLAANTPDPTSNPQNQDEEKELVSFLVRRNGQVMYKDRDVGIGAVRGIVAPAMRQEEHPITVNVEPEAQMRLVVAVIDECESGGAPQVTMKTVTE